MADRKHERREFPLSPRRKREFAPATLNRERASTPDSRSPSLHGPLRAWSRFCVVKPMKMNYPRILPPCRRYSSRVVNRAIHSIQFFFANLFFAIILYA